MAGVSGAGSLGTRARIGLSSWFSTPVKEKELRRIDSEKSTVMGAIGGQEAGANGDGESDAESASEMLSRLRFKDQPNFDEEGSLLDEDEQTLVWQWIPARQRVKKAVLVYSGKRHGYNLHTLYRLSDEIRHKYAHRKGFECASLMLIKTDKQELIGSYTSTAWRHYDRYFGNGECNVFRIRPRPRRYRWQPSRDALMMLGSVRSLSVGAEGGPAIWIDDDLQQGSTCECETFGSPPLTTVEEIEIVVCPLSTSGAEAGNSPSHSSSTRTRANFNCVAVEVFILL